MDTRLLVALLVLLIRGSWGEDGAGQPDPQPVKRGRYVPELHGATGWYVPDNSGKYRHDPRPYDGGYGDRGEPYSSDLRGLFRNVQEQLEARVQEARGQEGNGNLALGPRDHLRFMIDFNFNGTGWQIIQFQWLRDGDESHPDSRRYNYVNENKLWEDHGDQAYEYQDPGEECEASCQPESEVADERSSQEQQLDVQEAVEEQKPQSSGINSEQDVSFGQRI